MRLSNWYRFLYLVNGDKIREGAEALEKNNENLITVFAKIDCDCSGCCLEKLCWGIGSYHYPNFIKSIDPQICLAKLKEIDELCHL